jgi:tRNA(Ile)-lysidine synthetase-like protein
LNLREIQRAAVAAVSAPRRHHGLDGEDQARRMMAASSSSSSSQSQPLCRALYLLGVSGGSDSVALFHLMVRHIRSVQEKVDVDPRRDEKRQLPPPVLHVVHFNHQQRGSESDRDCEFVRALCRDHSVPCHVYSWEQVGSSVELGPSPSERPLAFSQDVARKWRRRTMKQLLSNLLRDHDRLQQQQLRAIDPKEPVEEAMPAVGILLTAHHLNDSHESLLLKLLRGTHVTNLQGMSLLQADSDLDGGGEFDDRTRIALVWGRPLLSIPKSQLVRFLKANGCEWREDASNASSKYLRNRVRNELVPLLTDLVGGSEATLQRRLEQLAQQSREMQEHFHLQGKEQLRISLSPPSESRSLLEPASDVFHLLATTAAEQARFHPDVESSPDLVAQHALHQWLVQTTQARSRFKSTAASIPYEQIQRIFAQLKNYPRNRSWRLDVGENWAVVRQGDVLRVEASSAATGDTSCRGLVRTVELEWSPAKASSAGDSNETALLLHLPSAIVEHRKLRLLSAPASAVAPSSPFCPPWRTSSVSLKDFLRGQKVPLHQRSQTPLILLEEKPVGDQPSGPFQVVAVHVASRARQWTVDARYVSDACGTSPIRVSAHSL